MRIPILFSALLVMAACQNSDIDPGDIENRRYRIAQVSSTINGQTPGDYLFYYDSNDQLDFIINEGQVLEDGRFGLFEFGWVNGKLADIQEFTFSTQDTILIREYNYSYSGTSVSKVMIRDFDSSGKLVKEDIKTYRLYSDQSSRSDTVSTVDVQYISSTQYSFNGGLQERKIYQQGDVYENSSFIRLEFTESIPNPIQTLGMPDAYNEILLRPFGLEFGDIPEIYFESDLLPTSITITSTDKNGTVSSSTSKWTYILSAFNRTGTISSEDRMIEVDWVEY